MVLSLGSRNLVTGVQQPHEPSEDRTFPVGVEIDFSNEFVAADVPVALMIHPVNCRVSNVFHAVRTAEGSTMTYDIGTDTDADAYVDGADGNASTLGSVQPALDRLEAQGLITVTPKNNAETMVLYVEVEFTRTTNSLGSA